MFDKASNSKKRGDIGVAVAIAYFAKEGFTVSIPLTDSQEYDLIVDKEDTLSKVQVKTTSRKVPSGSYEVGLRTMGGNQSFSTIKKFDKSKVQYLFALTEEGDTYLIPSEDIVGENSITLGTLYQKYKV